MELQQLIRKIENSLYKGFIDQNKPVSAQFKPKLLTNKHHENVLSTLLQELKTCKTFTFSVAFITEGGLATLKTMLYDIKQKGIKGRILTSTFLNFNQPKMFKELLKLENVEVRLTSEKGFHAKGYIFEHQDYFSLIVGSSNLTDSALKANYEWNVFLTSLESGEIINHFKNQFEDAWDEAILLNEEWIAKYKQYYKFQPFVKHAASNTLELNADYLTNALADSLSIKPNKMQAAALEQLNSLRATGAQKGLIISATGTGKTYLSAFDVRRFSPEKMLFIVHREQILKKALKDYRKILGGHEDDYGILSGNSKDLHVKYLFATIQTISKEGYLQQFAKNQFDYVLIDEVHKAGSESYLKIIDYFNPKFLLGMTATPERTDGFNIYELFDYNIAYEIRLQAALEEGMLCPFHYFGVLDYEKDGETIDDATELRKLVSSERVKHIIEKINYYGFSGEHVRGLMFCSSKEEVRELSTALNHEGLKTIGLTGDNSQEEREEAIRKLNRGELEYILSVDIFNEGIDIPFLNQIVMLRQTQSSIIFIQQLGRGLRKHDSKDYVTIIDFIGNYKNNYLIPIALSGDQTMNKDNVRRRTVNTNYIQGVSTINFEEIAKKKIFEAINNTNLSTLKILRDTFTEMKNRLGRIPTLFDFIEQNSIDPEVIAGYSDNYFNFLLKMKESIPSLTEYELSVLSMFSKEFLNGKRIHEILLIENLLANESMSQESYIQKLKNFGTYVDDETIQSVLNIFSLKFHVQSDVKKYKFKPIIEVINGNYQFNEEIQESIRNSYFKGFIEDIVKCAYVKNEKYDKTNAMKLFEKYSRRDVCRLLNWPHDDSSTIYGYRAKHNTCPIFVTYHKKNEVETSQAYGDEFLARDLFRWFTRNRLTLDSNEVKNILSYKDLGMKIYLFTKKDDGEGTDFYYLGQVDIVEDSAKNETMPDGKGNELSVVTMNLVLEQPVQYDIYHYLVEE
ncbi:DEAD/DEAH box helicase [Niallia sp.]|uniref:DEAD/DEAH box helicase n=1 Tax=Niallia sp. TaxID=2837523 RepID=UPI00289997E8|nr:DEAD/DEAH box helicase [Niallia sp.]